MTKPLMPLPIDPLLPQALKSLESHPCLVLQAAPGTGKTTRVPPALLRASFIGPKSEVAVLEPRRLAAKLSARRVAQEMGEPIGRTVGYQFRFERVAGTETRLLYLTEGMLMRRMLGDPLLKGVSAVVLDEFHERHLQGDLALAYLRWLQKEKRPELRLVVMSATLDAGPISAFLGGCPILEAQAKRFDVETTYLSAPSTKYLDVQVRDAVRAALEREDCGDILVFLPGMGDIRRAQAALEQAFSRKELLIAPLHGELSREEQDLAIEKASIPKVILSTNVAETSLTIEGVRTVIDSGLHRQASYSHWSGVPALKTRPISRASAIQRAGRAGRQAPGRCFRLYVRGDFDGRAPFDAPEIQRADLAQALLELKLLGVDDLARYEWFEHPGDARITAGVELLYRLGALESARNDAALTPLGRRLAAIPAHPRLGRMLLEAEGSACLEDAGTLAALIQEGRLEGMDALAQLKSARGDESIRRARTQLLGSLGPRSPNSRKHELAACVLAGFPDRVGRLRKGELLLATGGSARVDQQLDQPFGGEYFIVLDIQEKQHLRQARSQMEVRSVCPIREEWLLDVPALIREEERMLWDAPRKRVLSAQVLSYGEITLTEDRKPPQDAVAAARVLVREGLGVSNERMEKLEIFDLIRTLSLAGDPEQIESALARIELYQKYFPSPDALALDRANTGPLLLKLAEGKLALEDIGDPAHALLGLLPPEAQAKLDQLLPPTVTLPGGRKPKVQYRLNQAPWIESRLQDFFGMKQGPALLNGRLPLTLHLLAPNQRAVQVTTDLAGFWERAYREIRRELSRNYPRHSWPENPLEATPPPPRGPRR